MNIIHQQQPTPWSCGQTCLAMLLGVPVEDVLHVFPSKGMSQREMFTALDRCGFRWNALMFGTLVTPGLYLLGVPSLNLEAGGHTILVDYRGESEPSHVYDPNNGKPGKKFYGSKTVENGVELGWWTDAIVVQPGGGLPL